jgi:hypothetical protein
MTHSIDPTDEAVEEGRVLDEAPDPRRWWALTVLAVAQLMIVLDASIVRLGPNVWKNSSRPTTSAATPPATSDMRKTE